jgi:hypothetical protein
MRIHDVDISAGATILLLIGAANRDPRRYPDPNLFDPHRNPTDHAAFGWAIHLCLGAALARLEAKVAFEALVRHGDNVTLTDAQGHTESLHSSLWPASRTEVDSDAAPGHHWRRSNRPGAYPLPLPMRLGVPTDSAVAPRAGAFCYRAATTLAQTRTHEAKVWSVRILGLPRGWFFLVPRSFAPIEVRNQ